MVQIQTFDHILWFREGCTIGILDISGFENLGRNSFEQLCINIINERLQNYLNKHIFECEKLIYLAEGVDLNEGGIDFQDNEEIIAMLTKVRKNTFFDKNLMCIWHF